MRSVIFKPAPTTPSPSPSPSSARPRPRRVLLYFISGNPGLIDFYADFLDCLRSLLDSSETRSAYDVYGRNLLGFKDDEHEPFGPHSPPFDLDGQIEAIYHDIAARRATTTGVASRGADESAGDQARGQPYDAVILMGHSVGAYIAVDVFHRHLKNPARAPHLNLSNGILLFPTLTSIALSPNGKNMTLLHRLPTFTSSAHAYARLGLTLLSRGALVWFVETVLRFSPGTARLTAEWLKSRDGIWQTLYLARCEMEGICEDKWDEGIWEVAAAAAAAAATATTADGEGDEDVAPKFFMLYGRDDPWVANDIRDDFMAKRKEHGLRRGRTRIVVDEGKLKHAFCTREDESLVVARRVHEWIGEIDGMHRTA